MVTDFKLILSCNTFLTLPDNEPSNAFLRHQLVWHRHVGSDKMLPLGTFSNMNKVSMKKLVAEALNRQDQGVVDVEMEDQEPRLEDIGMGDQEEDIDIDMADVEDAEHSNGEFVRGHHQ